MPRRPLSADVAASVERRARLRAELAAEEARLAELLEAQRRLVEEIEAEHRNAVLHNRHGEASVIDTMDAAIQVRGARLGTKHAGAVSIRRVDGSIGKFAAKHGLKPTTVRSWYAKGEAARRIPRAWADLLGKSPYGVPLAAWRNGIDEG